jgi:hypothetical protein
MLMRYFRKTGRRLRVEQGAPQQALCVVAIAEETTVYGAEPLFAPRAHDEQGGPDQREPPPARLQHRHKRLRAVDDDVHQQQRAQSRDQRVNESAREGILQAAADDEAESNNRWRRMAYAKDAGTARKKSDSTVSVEVAKMSAPGFCQ